MRGVVVARQEVAQPQRERRAGRVHVGGAVEGTQHLIMGGAVEALDGAVALRIPGGAVDQQGVQAALNHRRRVVGDEARPVVQKEQISEPVAHDHVVEAAQEQCAGLRSAHHDVQAVTSGVVEEEQRHPAQPRRAGAEVLAVGEHALHALGVAPAPQVRLAFVRSPAGRQAQPPARPPHGGAIDAGVDRDDAACPCAAHQLRRRGAWITLLLGVQELDQLRTQCH